jgi:hypothetical protein
MCILDWVKICPETVLIRKNLKMVEAFQIGLAGKIEGS